MPKANSLTPPRQARSDENMRKAVGQNVNHVACAARDRIEKPKISPVKFVKINFLPKFHKRFSFCACYVGYFNLFTEL
jgi:hypothetical protein